VRKKASASTSGRWTVQRAIDARLVVRYLLPERDRHERGSTRTAAVGLHSPALISAALRAIPAWIASMPRLQPE